MKWNGLCHSGTSDPLTAPYTKHMLILMIMLTMHLCCLFFLQHMLHIPIMEKKRYFQGLHPYNCK